MDFIKKHEGCKLKAYKCPAGVWTIGYGSTTFPDGRKVKAGDTITQQDAQRMLEYEIRTRLAQMKLPTWLSFPQKTAILSWQYNCGQGAWMKSKLRQLILAKAPNDDIYRQWTTTYLTAQGRKNPILKKRRVEEAEMYTTNKFNLLS
jgi:lysozyme